MLKSIRTGKIESESGLQNMNRKEKKPGIFFRSKIIIAGMLLIWSASIILALEIKTLLTPGNFPIGSDPSFDITLAAFCIVLCLLGALLLWRGILEREHRLEIKFERYLNVATIFTVVLLCFVFAIVGLIFSANIAFSTAYKPLLRDRPRPDYSMPAFPTPLAAQPTPTYDPSAKYMAGPIKSAMDGLRVGDIWISMSPEGETIHSIQVYIHRIECSVQEGTSVTTFAVDKSEQLIAGPIQILDDKSFYAGQEMAAIHGIAGELDQAFGTIHLRFTDPANKNHTCDLGSFDWTAALTTNN
jgi:hypothetical protein